MLAVLAALSRFCGEYKLGAEIHTSATAVVVRAVDTQNTDVVLKFMQHPEQHQCELAARSQGLDAQGLDDRFVVGIRANSDDIPGFATAAAELGYAPRGIVMDAAAKALSEVLLHDNLTLDVVVDLVRQLCLCIQHMHNVGRIHGALSLICECVGHCAAVCQAI